MEENNNNEQPQQNKAKQFFKNQAKSFGKNLAIKFIKWSWPVLSVFLIILLIVGLINAITNTVFDKVSTLLEESGVTVTVGHYDSTILGAAEQVHQEQKDWTYWTKLPGGLSTLKSPVENQLTNSEKSTCCASYVSCVLYASGYISSETLGYNFHQPYVVEDILENKVGWTRIDDVNQIQPGDIVFYDNEGMEFISGVNNDFYHVDIYAGDDTFYTSSQKEVKGNWQTRYKYTWAYRVPEGLKPQYGPVPIEAPTEQLICLDENGEYKLVVDNLAELILEELESQKVNNELAGFVTDEEGEEELSEEELQDMIDKYIKVEANTTLPQIYDKWYQWFERLFSIDGMIKVERAVAVPPNVDTKNETNGENALEGEIITLKYKKLSEFEKLAEPEIYKYFSLTEDFQLCIARQGSTTVYYDENDNIIGSADTGEDKIVIEKIPYLTYIEKYATPFNFLIALHTISEDKEFMEDVVKLALGEGKEETVVLTYVETASQQIEKIQYEGKTKKERKLYDSQGNEIPETELNEGEYTNFVPVVVTDINNQNVKSEVTNVEIDKIFKTVTTTFSGQLHVTKVDTWLVSSEKILTKKERGTESKSSEDIIGHKDSFEYIKTQEQLTPEGYTQKTTISQWLVKNTIDTYSNWRYTIVDNGFEIKADDFVNLIRGHKNAENCISSAPNNLFYLLQKNENTETLEKVMRYVLYKLNDVDYGVTEEDLKVLFSDAFATVENIGTLKSYLEQFSDNPKVELSEDEKFYKMYGDENGTPFIGTEILHIETYFNTGGSIMHNGEVQEVENIVEYLNQNVLPNGIGGTYTSAQYDEMNFYIEKKLVDNMVEKLYESMYNAVTQELSGLRLSRQEIYALVAIYKDFGYLPDVNGKSFKDIYIEAQEKFEEESWEKYRYIWDNWWCMLGEDNSQDIINRDAQFETYMKGTFDYSLSEAGELFARNKYIYYTEQQLAKYRNAQNLPVTRNVQDAENEEKIFTMEEKAGTFEASGERYICGYYTSTTGRRFTILDQIEIDNYSAGWRGYCNRAACAIIASGYSDETPKELIDRIDGADCSNANPIASNGYFSKYGLKRGGYLGAMSVSSYVNTLRKHLLQGGYAAIWVHNSSGYEGLSKSWTSGTMHWVAILDYKVKDGEEKILIADHSGAKWYPIDEFSGKTNSGIVGISNMVLIEEK